MINPDIKKGWFDPGLDWGKIGRIFASISFCIWIGAQGWVSMRDNLAENSAAIRQLSAKLDAGLIYQADHISNLKSEFTIKLQVESDKNVRERQILETRLSNAEARLDFDERRSHEDAAALGVLKEQSAATLNYLRDLVQNLAFSKRTH